MKHIPSLALALLGGLVSTGCQPSPAEPRDVQPVPLGAAFDPANTGTIRGRVVWSGQASNIEPIKLLVKTKGVVGDQPNPNAPSIDSKTSGMGQVLVYLRVVNPEKSRPWDHPPVDVTFADGRLEIRQGKEMCRIGIVRRGDSIACVAREKKSHNLEARGASVFSLPLVEPDKVTNRILKNAGVLELLSGTGYFWLRGYLWVGDHPYAALTGPTGEFEMKQVPVGEYELVCWSPNWHVQRKERHPESGDIERLIFKEAVDQTMKVRVTHEAAAPVEFRWSEQNFSK